MHCIIRAAFKTVSHSFGIFLLKEPLTWTNLISKKLFMEDHTIHLTTSRHILVNTRTDTCCLFVLQIEKHKHHIERFITSRRTNNNACLSLTSLRTCWTMQRRECVVLAKVLPTVLPRSKLLSVFSIDKLHSISNVSIKNSAVSLL